MLYRIQLLQWRWIYDLCIGGVCVAVLCVPRFTVGGVKV